MISGYLKFSDLFKIPLVLKKFYAVSRENKKFKSTRTFSKYILNFGEDCFDFLRDELKYLSKDIRETFRKKVINNFFVFSLVNIKIEKMISEMFSFKVYCHSFYCRRDSRLVGNVISATDFLLMIRILRKNLMVNLLLQKNPLKLYSVGELMETVSANTIVLNIYLVGEYQSKTENYGELFFEVANNSFGVYIFYVQIYLRMFFNLLKPGTEMVIDSYLSEHSCCSHDVSKTRKKITSDLFSCYMKTALKLLN